MGGSNSINAQGQEQYVDRTSDILGSNYQSIPVLNIGNRQGSTDYLDFIDVKELTAPIMRGVDRFRRPFVVIKMKGWSDEVGKEVYFAQTYFQRYSDKMYPWVGGHVRGRAELFSTSGGMRDIEFDTLKQICEGKTVTSFDADRLAIYDFNLVGAKLDTSTIENNNNDETLSNEDY